MRLWRFWLRLCSFLFVYLLKRAISKTLRKSTGYARRLRALFLIAASSFVFPVIFVIIELVFMTRKLSETTLASINISGTNVEIIGVLFATIWASSAQSENEVNSNKTPSTSGGSSGYSGYSGGVNGVNGRIRMPSRPRPLSSRVIDISVTRQTETIPTFTTGQTFRSSMTNTTASPIDRDYDVDHGHEAVILEMEEIEMERLKGLEEEREDRDSSSFEPKKGGRGVRSAIEEV
ncbi:hypothetical protein D9758_007558 [Tetrapyrgos nigripes]|uniref:Uncharacterized protein n=1 Tax=Tetrapyrgos nigripes TaxID=182062 RepID=A0A8H5G811_9AGAR|nr:hypothetical protein D9758_007558 [Tetrapyrgos nigripes]